MGMVNNTARRGRELTVLPEQHEDTCASMVLYFGARDIGKCQCWRPTKGDATYSKRPLSRYSTATKARTAVLSIQNLLRIIIRIDFGREEFWGECAQNGGEDVEVSMQTSSTSQNDKEFRGSRPSQSQGWV